MPLENEAIKIAEELGSMSYLVPLWLNHSVSCLLLGEAAEGESFARRVLLASRRFGTGSWTLPAVFILSCCATAHGNYLKAATLVGACERLDLELSESSDWEWNALEIQLRDNNRANLIAHLGIESFERARNIGQQLKNSQFVDLALDRTPASS